MEENDNKRYAVKIICRDNIDRYVAWCNECWYGTTRLPTPRFTHMEALKIVNQMKNHYRYILDVVSETGEVEHFNHLWSARHNRELPKRKTIFKMVMNKPFKMI